jgi:glycerol-3-phosphate O-acyltransferase/dihydroxyacetone phosphate acyltransferase
MLYRVIRAMAHVTVHLFFHRIDVENPQNVPKTGPLLFVANHSNALVDPLVIMTAIHRDVTLTAKNVLAKNALLRWLMAACHVITFHRGSDVGQGASRRQNVSSIHRCTEVLANGGSICIFPEGISHSDAKLRPFRNGVSHVALRYIREYGDCGSLRIVPVGLLYTAKDQFRSDVWVRFGEPVDVGSWMELHPKGTPADLTRSLEQHVAALTLNMPSRGGELLLKWTADIVVTQADRPASLGSDTVSTAEWFRLVAALQEGRSWLNQYQPDRLKQLSSRIREYRRRLQRTGIVPAEVFLTIRFGRAAFFLLRELELVFLGGPMALFGAINHAMPYFTVKWIATRLSRDKDHWASNVVYSSLVVLPFFYCLQVAVVSLLVPTWWAVIYAVAVPYTGYYAILYGDRLRQAWRRAGTFTRFAFHPEEQHALATEGREIVQEIRDLQQVVESQRPPDLATQT